MGLDAVIVLLVLTAFLVVSIRGLLPVDLSLVAAMVVLMVTQVLEPEEALVGFSNPALFVIAAFYVVSAAVQESGALNWMSRLFLRYGTTERRALSCVILPVALFSSFVANTPIVAIFIPQIQDWSKKIKVSASKLLIPLSYASILGGTCTLLGTSTNILLYGLIEKTEYRGQIDLLTPLPVGIALVAVGLVYFLLIGRHLLPDRKSLKESLGNLREYAIYMQVDPSGTLPGKTIQQAGLRHLQYAYLHEIQSGEIVRPAVGPEELLNAGDILVFVGQPESVAELRAVPGLIGADKQSSKLNIPTSNRALVELVVAESANLVGKSIRDSQFRTKFGGAILAVSRNGERINQKVGDIVLRVGDTLLIETSPGFELRHRYNRNFLLVSRLDHARLSDLSKAPVCLAGIGIFVAGVFAGLWSMVTGSFLLAAYMVVTRCINTEVAQKSIDVRLIAAIGASLALGVAVSNSGLASMAASGLLALGGDSPLANLIVLYVATVIVTELISNNATVVLMFPIAQALAAHLGVDLIPFAVAIMFAASAGFLTPIGYQTNLMVQGPGNYHFNDFVRVGAGLSLLVGIVVVTLIPMIWSF